MNIRFVSQTYNTTIDPPNLFEFVEEKYNRFGSYFDKFRKRKKKKKLVVMCLVVMF